jgi:hypothetical protein
MGIVMDDSGGWMAWSGMMGSMNVIKEEVKVVQ